MSGVLRCTAMFITHAMPSAYHLLPTPWLCLFPQLPVKLFALLLYVSHLVFFSNPMLPNT